VGLLGLSGSLAGCGGGVGRLPLEGAVTYKGEPVAFGQIYFDPDAGKGNNGVQGAADIEDGRYRTLPDLGPAAGPHVARVTGYARKPTSPAERPLFTDARVVVDIPAGARTLDIAVPVAGEK
jgi:hypothetical protein